MTATTREYSKLNGDRYEIDFVDCKAANGYAQIDTSQDAWYFGQWANPHKRHYVSYCEGDITEITFTTDEEFGKHIRSVVECYQEGFKGIDGMCRDSIIDKFKELGLGDLLH